MTTPEMITLILRLMGSPDTRESHHRAEAAAPLVLHAVKVTDIDPIILAAVLMKEASFRRNVSGNDGEIGMGQIKPGRLARKLCRGLDLRRPVYNVLCSARYLEHAKRTCGPSPRTFLGHYNSGRCGPSVYGDRVLEIIRRAEVDDRPTFSEVVAP